MGSITKPMAVYTKVETIGLRQPQRQKGVL